MRTRQLLVQISISIIILLAITGCNTSVLATRTPASITLQPIAPTQLLGECGGGTLAAIDDLGLILRDLPGSNSQRVAIPSKDYVRVSFSPDGYFLAFSKFAGIGGLFLLNIGNGEFEHLDLGHEQLPRSPVWSPDGKKLAYSDGDPDSYHYVYLVDIDDPANPIALPPAEHSDYEEPETWRTDGDLLLSVSGHINKPYPIGKVRYSELVIVNTVSGKRKTIYASKSYNVEGQWSPDGEWIVATEGNPRVTFLLDWQNNTKKVLEKIPLNSTNLVWSPNGKCIAFLDPLNYIQVYSLDTSKTINLSAVGGYHALAWGK